MTSPPVRQFQPPNRWIQSRKQFVLYIHTRVRQRIKQASIYRHSCISDQRNGWNFGTHPILSIQCYAVGYQRARAGPSVVECVCLPCDGPIQAESRPALSALCRLFAFQGESSHAPGVSKCDFSWASSTCSFALKTAARAGRKYRESTLPDPGPGISVHALNIALLTWTQAPHWISPVLPWFFSTLLLQVLEACPCR